MTDPFATHGIGHLSASSLNTYAAQPAAWAISYLLKRRLLTEPRAFRELFISDGMQAVAWEFQQPELGADFVRSLWQMLLRDDDSSTVLMRFLWDLPLGMKRKFSVHVLLGAIV